LVGVRRIFGDIKFESIHAARRWIILETAAVEREASVMARTGKTGVGRLIRIAIDRAAEMRAGRRENAKAFFVDAPPDANRPNTADDVVRVQREGVPTNIAYCPLQGHGAEFAQFNAGGRPKIAGGLRPVARIDQVGDNRGAKNDRKDRSETVNGPIEKSAPVWGFRIFVRHDERLRSGRDAKAGET